MWQVHQLVFLCYLFFFPFFWSTFLVPLGYTGLEFLLLSLHTVPKNCKCLLAPSILIYKDWKANQLMNASCSSQVLRSQVLTVTLRSIEWNSDSVCNFIRGYMVSVLLCPAYVPGCAPLNTEFFSLAKLSLPPF